jgi:hypothetical protein
MTDCSAARISAYPMRHSPLPVELPLEGTPVDTARRCVRYLFETYRNRSYFFRK